MTATDLPALIAAADLTDRTDRLMLADALEEAGRGDEAAALRTDSRLRLSGDAEIEWPLAYEIRMVDEAHATERDTIHAFLDEIEEEAERSCRHWCDTGSWDRPGTLEVRWTATGEDGEEVAEGRCDVPVGPDADDDEDA